MPFWKSLLEKLHLRPRRRRAFELDDAVLQSLNDLAARERRPADEVARHLVTRALMERQVEEEARLVWDRLTPREQQVVALICLNYTTAQIAGRLSISTETVKTHAHHALQKFGLPSRQALRQRMEHWDFASWDDQL